MLWIMVILLAVIVMLVLGSSISNNVASAQQAQAAIEAARAAQMASAGQTVSSVGLTIVVIVLAVLVLALVILIIRWDLMRRHAENEIVAANPARVIPGKWKSGPNAHWEKEGPGLQLTGDPMQQLVQLQILKMLKEMNQPAETKSLVEVKRKQVNPDDDDFPVTW